MRWLILIFKTALTILPVITLICDVIVLFYLARYKDTFIREKSELEFYISVALLCLNILGQFLLIILIVQEKACSLACVLLFMVVNLAWEIHVKSYKNGGKQYKDYVNTANFALYLVECILLMCYITLLCCK